MNMADIQQSTILIVDDAPMNVDFLVQYLNRAGFQVLIAKDGNTAIRQAKHVRPDIVLLDVLMPEMDGFETCRCLKRDKQTNEIPVIFMTALSDIGHKVQGFEVGAVDYVTKPLDPQEVMARVTTHLTLRSLQKDLQSEIAERKRTEEMLREYTTMLQAQNEELDAFAHTVAHNLKNPLGALAGLTELLQSDYSLLSSSELDDCLKLIVHGGRKAITIIDELLLLASVRKKEVEPEPLDMIEIINESQERLADMITQSKSRIIIPPHWPLAIGYGPWVEEVWVNYLSNAIKYGGRPPVVELGATMQANNKVCFWVKDNGPGLTPTEQSHLFTPFTRLSKLDVQGHGLGLSIVRRIVEKLDGEVGIESNGEPGQGSIFNFTLPAVVN